MEDVFNTSFIVHTQCVQHMDSADIGVEDVLSLHREGQIDRKLMVAAYCRREAYDT